MSAQRVLETEIKQQIDNSVNLAKDIVIQQSNGSVIVQDKRSNKDIEDTINSLNRKKLLIKQIQFNDESSRTKIAKQASFIIMYSSSQFQDRKSLIDFIKNELNVSDCTIVEKQKILFQGQNEFRNLLSEQEIKQVAENFEQRKRLLQKIDILDRKVTQFKKEEEEKGKEIAKQTALKDKIRTENTDLQKAKNSSKKAITDLEKQYTNLINEIKQKESTVKDQQLKINELKNQMEATKKQIDNHQDLKKIEQAIKDKDLEINKQKQLIQQIKNNIETSKKAVETLTKSNEQVELKCLDQEFNKIDLQKENYILNQKIKTFDDQIQQYKAYLKE